MGEKHGFELHNFMSHLLNFLMKSLIFVGVRINFTLQVVQPLLLTLSTFKSSNPGKGVS